MKQLEVGKTLIANIPMRKDNSSEINDYPNLYFGNILEANNSKVPPVFYVQVLVRFLCEIISMELVLIMKCLTQLIVARM